MKYRVEVLGCKVNQYEAEQIKVLLDRLGGVESAAPESDDIVVLHSCAVTAQAVRKVRQMIRQAARKSPRAQILVSGCAAKDGIVSTKIGGIRYVPSGSGWLERLADVLAELGLGSCAAAIFAEDVLPLDEFRGHHRAFLKIQDGCDINCSYCIVPTLRGASRDKPMDTVLDEARMLIAGGHREIVVAGVSVGLYGKRSRIALARVMDRLARIEDLERIRLSSLHPAELTDELLAVWQANPKILPHIHLSLQSGSDSVLKSMRRGYRSREFLEAVGRAKECLDKPAFTTDIIVGFPGEGDSDFDATLKIAAQVGFSRMHIFPYSARPGTQAAQLGPAIPKATVKARVLALRSLSAKLRRNFHQSLLGRESTVLIESYDRSLSCGRGYTERYVPAFVKCRADAVGQILKVSIRSSRRDGVLVEPI